MHFARVAVSGKSHGQDVGVAALCYQAWALWLLEYVDQAAAIAAQAMRNADEPSDCAILAMLFRPARRWRCVGFATPDFMVEIEALAIAD